MMKRTHVFMGLAATIPFANWDNAPYIPVAVLGAIAADIDRILETKQRGISHSILALISSTAILTVFNYQLGLLWGLNYAIHLFLDSITSMGVPLLYPFCKKYYGFKLIKTRGAEDMFTALLGIYLITNLLQ